MGGAKTVIARLPWRVVHAGYLFQERLYRRVFGLRAVGDLIYLGRTRYRGAGKLLADDTRIDPGDPLGVIHFDNLRLAAIERQPGNPRHREFVFLRLLRSSLAALAQRLRVDPELDDLAGFRGVTWMPARGRHLGFETEPMPAGMRTRWLKLHFRLMLYAFYPEKTRQAVDFKPHVYWLTRKQLLQRFAPTATSMNDAEAGAR
ncbi:MAG: YkoP family protein [Gammaproteobacteria bacterium]